MHFPRTRVAILTGVLTAGIIASFLSSPAQAVDGIPPQTTTPNIFTARVMFEEASSELDAANVEVISAKNRLVIAQGNESIYASALTAASDAVAAAESTVATKQGDMENLARSMYMNGGGASPLDILMISGSTDVPTAMETHEYLASASDATVADADSARAALATAEANRLNAQASLDSAHSDTLTAEQDEVQAETVAYQAQTKVNAAKDEYRAWLAQFTPQPGQDLMSPSLCDNFLVRALYDAGFRGEDLHEAWSIAMRESGGREDAISSSQDYGVFQLNKPTWGSQPWWDDKAILTRDYNIGVAYMLSQGGHTWVSWGLDGHGNVNPIVYQRSGWSYDDIENHIVKPYRSWYNQYPCMSVLDVNNLNS